MISCYKKMLKYHMHKINLLVLEMIMLHINSKFTQLFLVEAKDFRIVFILKNLVEFPDRFQ